MTNNTTNNTQESENKFPELGGFCTSPELYVKKTGKPHPFGILSEQIFGPSSSYRCSCGYLRHKTLDAGQVCPKCGTRCDSTDLRLVTFGNIKTITPFIKYTKKKEILKIIGKQNKSLLDPKQSDSNIAIDRFIVLNKNKTLIRIINSVDDCADDEIFIPFKISGLFSLIFIFRYLGYILKIDFIRDLFENNYINNVIKILPVDTRPVFKNKAKANSVFYEEINRYYISLINSNKRNKLLEPIINEDMQTWIEDITTKICNKDTEIINANVLEYEQIAAFTQYFIDSIYEWCFEKIRGKQGIIRSNVLSRTLEFSARTVVAVDPSIKPYELFVPRPTLYTLWLPYFLNYLIRVLRIFQADEAYYKVAIKKYYEIKEDKQIHSLYLQFLDWFCNDDSNKELMTFNGVTEKINLRQISWWNRQPSLWSHSCPAMKLVPRNDEEYVLGVNPLSIEPLNMDFDGDMSSSYVNHDMTALKEMYTNAFLQNVVEYDSNDSLLSTIRHDALYAAYILSQNFNNLDSQNIKYSIDKLSELPVTIEDLNDPYQTVSISNKLFTYGICLINKWLNFDEVVINFEITKKQIQDISKITYIYYNKNSKKYYDSLGNFEKHLMSFISMTNFVPTINVDQMSSMVNDNLHLLINKIPSDNQYLSYYINDALIDKAIDNFDHDCNLYKLYKSGSRFNKSQLARSCINIGPFADENNIINPEPINSSLIEGLTEKQFFMSSYGTRKGLVDKSRATPRSGYLARTLVMAMSCMELDEDDCGTEDGIKITIHSKDHIKSLIGKYYKEHQENHWSLIRNLDDVNVGSEIILRTPMKCHTKDFKICKKCFGEKNNRTKYIGVVAAQCLTERLTQLSMRSFA